MTIVSNERQVLVEQILLSMSALVRGIRRNFPTAVDELDITLRQCRAIMFLGEGPASMSKLAAAIGASLPSTTGLVDRLVQRGVVARHEDPHDRRLVICELTAKGAEIINALQDADRSVFTSLFEGLTMSELEVVREATLLLAREVHRPAPLTGPAVPIAARPAAVTAAKN